MYRVIKIRGKSGFQVEKQLKGAVGAMGQNPLEYIFIFHRLMSDYYEIKFLDCITKIRARQP